ncbi:hypothetical protein EUGRSUZ_J01728 [Eucalyptus grandis]|uniref:Uncharacterized protein n=2 Tax=Eucalyptus grandis TaxID=71139 RepID=A0ACC3J6D3_EUCGR|nr:hypothetical protein EUGRSUZ_J01728 [Eucalyptus grandis]
MGLRLSLPPLDVNNDHDNFISMNPDLLNSSTSMVRWHLMPPIKTEARERKGSINHAERIRCDHVYPQCRA